MLVAPMVNLQYGIVHIHVLNPILQFLVKNNTGRVQILVINTQRQDEMLPLTLGHLLAPRHLLAGLQRSTHVGLPELTGIINTIGQGHIGIKEVHSLLYLLLRGRVASCHKKHEEP